MVNATSSCSVEGCDKPVFARKFCSKHYRLDRMARSPECSIEGCDKKSDRRGMCPSHNYRLDEYGDANVDLKRHKGRVCSVDGCEDKHSGLGYCNSHLARFKRHGDPLEPLRREAGKFCSVDDCDKPHSSKGYCDKHYRRWKKHGDPLSVRKAAPVTTCNADGCDKPGERGYGLCGAHYYRFRRYGDPNAKTVKNVDNGGKCGVSGCDLPYKQDGYCIAHMNKFNPDGTIKATRDCRVCGDRIDFLEVVDGRTLRSDTTRCRDCGRRRPGNPITSAELAIRDRSWECVICGEDVLFNRSNPHPLSPSVDHIIPLARGGENTPENCALAHLVCNKSKFTSLPEEFDLTA